MPEDWHRHQRVLVEASKAVLQRFYEKPSNEKLIAIGYVFELWNLSPQFDLCGNIGTDHSERQELRWNSGDYKFPAGLLNTVNEVGAEWAQTIERLHKAAGGQDRCGEVYRGLIEISCGALVDLSSSGVFEDPARLERVRGQ